MIQIDYVFWFSIDFLLVHVRFAESIFILSYVICAQLAQIDTWHFLIGPFVVNHFSIKGDVAKNRYLAILQVDMAQGHKP